MVVENVSVAAFRTELTGVEYGVVEYSFRWYGFAATDDRLRAGDATLAEVTPEPDERRPSRPLSGDGWNLDDLWTDFDDCLDGCERIDPCEGSGFRSVEITRPDHRGQASGLEQRFASILDSDGNKTGEERVVYDDGPPYAEITLKAETSKIYDSLCNRFPDDYDDYRWSYRGAGKSKSTYCTPNSWTTIGTGDTQTVALSDCRCAGTKYEIRVRGIDSNGNVASTDTIVFWVNFVGC